jgi:hypothetical protein
MNHVTAQEIILISRLDLLVRGYMERTTGTTMATFMVIGCSAAGLLLADAFHWRINRL